MLTLSSQLSLVEFRQRRWVGSIRDTEDIIYSIIAILVFHHSLTIRRKVHHLQTFTLLVVGIRWFPCHYRASYRPYDLPCRNLLYQQ